MGINNEKPKLSMIIPVRNEEHLMDQINQFSNYFPFAEMMVVDTSKIKANFISWPSNVQYLHEPSLLTRAQAMNHGAIKANGSILWFVPIDCTLPIHTDQQIIKLVDQGVLAGTFLKTYEPMSFLLRIQNVLLNVLVKHFHKFVVGTNTLFIKKDLFHIMRGFEDVPIFEDLLFFQRLQKTTRIHVCNKKIIISSRRYRAHGNLKQILRNFILLCAFYLGISPFKLKKWYTS